MVILIIIYKRRKTVKFSSSRIGPLEQINNNNNNELNSNAISSLPDEKKLSQVNEKFDSKDSGRKYLNGADQMEESDLKNS